MDISTLSLNFSALRQAYDQGLSPCRLVEEIERRIRAIDDPAIWIHLLPIEQRLERARHVERQGNRQLPLYGFPFAIKDNIDLAGVPTTAACPAIAATPAASAPVVQRLLDAGALPVGKTNLDQFATGLSGVRSPHGAPRNPFLSSAIPGGSSSGSAVAVASGLAAFSLGTDTAGSGRVPAGLNNIVGLKPTRGALSTRGVIPACRSLDCVSIFALTCGDAVEVARVAEGRSPGDPFARTRPSPGGGNRSVLRVGIPGEKNLEFFGDAEAQDSFRSVAPRLRELGVEAVEVEFAPFREAGDLLYDGPWVAERWSALRHYYRENAEAFHPTVRAIVERGARVGGAEVFEGLHRLEELASATANEWEKMDALVVPTIPRPYAVADVVSDPVRLNARLGTYTNFVNLLDLCAVAVPAGFRSDGLPWGVTFIAPAWSEAKLLGLGSAWQDCIGIPLGTASAPAPRERSLKLPPDRIPLAVVGAHLSGQPLNGELLGAGARLAWSGATAPQYRLFALPGAAPKRPGLTRVDEGGASIEVEVWDFSIAEFGRFVAAVPAPLCIGTVSLTNGERVKGFLCESAALEGAEEITAHGGWRAYLEAGRRLSPGPPEDPSRPHSLSSHSATSPASTNTPS